MYLDQAACLQALTLPVWYTPAVFVSAHNRTYERQILFAQGFNVLDFFQCVAKPGGVGSSYLSLHILKPVMSWLLWVCQIINVIYRGWAEY